MAEIEFDLALDATWAEFHADLTRNLLTMATGESLLLESHHDSVDNDEQVRASVRLSCQPGPVLRCEIPHHRFLQSLRRLSTGQRMRLEALGVRPPSLFDDIAPEDNVCDGSPIVPRDLSKVFGPDGGHSNERGEFGQRAHHLDVGRDEVGRLVDLALIVLRDCWQIPDPSFLRASVAGAGGQGGPVASGEGAGGEGAAGNGTPGNGAGGDSAGGDGAGDLLPRLIVHTLNRRYGRPPAVDGYGDHLVPLEGQRIQVSALPEEGYVDVFADVLYGVLAQPDTETTIAALNESWPYGRLVLVDGVLVAVLRVDAAPLLPPHLLRAIEHVSALLGQAGHLAEHLGGTPVAHAATHDPDPSALTDHELIAQHLLLTALLLAGDPVALFTPREAAEAAEGDLTSLAESVAVAEELHGRWLAAAQEPRLGIGGLSEHVAQAYGWREVADRLRAGLHLLTRPPAHEGQQLALFDEED